MAASLPSSPAYQWFTETIGNASSMQLQAWQAVADGEHTLISAPTGAGKTLAAMLPLMDKLQLTAVAKTRILYITPLKALSHDVERNLQQILDGIADVARQSVSVSPDLRAAVRTGDTAQSARRQQLQQPPQILVTTPESLFILLAGKSGREALASVRHVVIDELHALAENKRGAHLMLSLQRLQKRVSRPLQRIAMSATQKPLDLLGQWLTGGQACQLVQAEPRRDMDIQLALPASPLGAILSNVQLEQIAQQVMTLTAQRRTTLVFVNTRRLAEKLSRLFNELLEEQSLEHCIALGTHHGSLSREARLAVEQQLKSGQLNIVIATSSLELGIDIGSVDMVCQLGSPKRFSAMLQRAGRAGHQHGGVPAARLFPLTRDDLLESHVLIAGMRAGELDQLQPVSAPLDVLAQQILAECALQQQTETELADWIRKSWDYRQLSDTQLHAVLGMLADGFSGRQEQVRLLWNKPQGRLQANADLSRLCSMNAGAIPDQFDQDVWLLSDDAPRAHLGTVDEDFAFESMPGDIVQLGNRSLQIVKSNAEGLHVRDAQDMPPAIPFWFGEGAGRSQELSQAIETLLQHVDGLPAEQILARQWLTDFEGSNAAAQQLANYLAAAKAALGCLPHARQIVIERFFDDTGNFHVIVHSTAGIAINRAWGMALRKRFCRQFNFELQANATDNGLLMSLGPTHSFPLEDIIGYLKSHNVRQVLLQALLDSPLFIARWRWACNTSLAVPRMRNGKKVQPQVQRNQAEDLLALLFPDQLACLENIRGEREIPEHPLVQQVIEDCMHEAMDIEGLEALLMGVERGEIDVHCVDLNAPSPLAEELIHGKPWSFIDDGEAEDRRTRTITTQRLTASVADAEKLQGIPEATVLRQKQQCWPPANNPDSLYELLCHAGYLRIDEARQGAPAGVTNPMARQWPAWFAALRRDYRATVLQLDQQAICWVADQHCQLLQALCPQLQANPELPAYAVGDTQQTPEQALQSLLRLRLGVSGLTETQQILPGLPIVESDLQSGILALQNAGDIIAEQQSAGAPLRWALRRHLQILRRQAV